MSAKSVLVVGGGVVGLAAAWRLLQRDPGLRLTLLEKEPEVGAHQAGHNSGVLHCGLAYRPGSLKAQLAVRGIRQMVEFCREHGVAYEVCGKLIVAQREDQRPGLHVLLEKGTANGVGGLEILNADQMREIEPHAAGVAALRVPEEGIVDYIGVCQALRRQIEAAGGRVLCQAPVLALHWRGQAWIAETPAGEQEGAFLLTCAGLQADRVSRMAGEKPDVLIVPFRGDYYRLRADRTSLVRHLIYPVADPRFPFLGVHLTRRIQGGIDAGPNAVLALKREGYARTDFAWNDAVEALSFPGLWRFIRKYPSIAASEVRRAFSPALFAKALQSLVPEIRQQDLVDPHAGVRAQAMRADGSLVDDFVLLERPNALHVLNAPSPAVTASLAIGEVIAVRVNL